MVPLNAFTTVQCVEAGIEDLTNSLIKSNTNVIYNPIGMFYSTLRTAPAQRSSFLTRCKFTYLSNGVLNILNNMITIII
jgi:hypothetical protein